MLKIIMWYIQRAEKNKNIIQSLMSITINWCKAAYCKGFVSIEHLFSQSKYTMFYLFLYSLIDINIIYTALPWNLKCAV